MKRQFAVAVAILYGTSALAAAPGSIEIGVERPIFTEPLRAAGGIAPVPAAQFQTNSEIPEAAVLAPAAQAPEAAPASALPSEPASPAAQAAAGAANPISADAPNARPSSPAAPHLSGAAAEQARAAAADGNSMDGAASAGQSQALDAAKIKQAYSSVQAKAYAGIRWSQSKPQIGDYSTLPLSDPGVATAYQFSAMIPANATYFIIVRTSVIGQPTMFSNPIAFGTTPPAASASAGRRSLLKKSALGKAQAAPATATALASKTTLNAADFKGKPLFEMLTAPDGLKASLDAAETAGFTVADWATVQAKIAAFDPTDPKKINSLFKSPDGFQNLVDALAGKSATPRTMAGIIAAELKTEGSLAKPDEVGLAGAIIAPLLSLASGSGVEFRIDDKNTTFHFGYKSGADQVNDPKSGRSFSLTAGRTALDPSDNYYLAELGGYFSSEGSDAFFKAILPALTQSDFSGWKSLSPKGQTLASDFIAIYLAEADRNDMTGFKTHPWQKDLLAVTLLSSYAVKAGVVMKGRKVVPGEPSAWFGIGKAGSGIGESRSDREAFSGEITSAEASLHPDVVSAADQLVGISHGDLIQGFANFINDPSKQDAVQANADALNQAMIAFLTQIRDDSDAITQALEGSAAPAQSAAAGGRRMMGIVAPISARSAASAPNPALVKAAMSYQNKDQIEKDTDAPGPLAANLANGNDLTGQAKADFDAWSAQPGAQAPQVFKVRLRDPNKTAAYYMFQSIGRGVGTNFAYYTMDGARLVFGSEADGGNSRFNQYLDLSSTPLFSLPSPSDPAASAAPLTPAQIAALAPSIEKGLSNTSGYNDFDTSFAVPADPSILAGDAKALFAQWAADPVSLLPPPAAGEADINKPAVYRTTLRVGSAVTSVIYVSQHKVTGRFAPDWVNFAFFTASGQLIVNGSYNGGLKWGQLVNPGS